MSDASGEHTVETHSSMGLVMAVYTARIRFICVLCASCGSSQCCIRHDLQFVDAGRGCKRRPYGRGILQSRSHDCLIGSHGVSFCLRHPVAMSVFIMCSGLCACTQNPNDTAYNRCSCHSGHKLRCKLCRTVSFIIIWDIVLQQFPNFRIRVLVPYIILEIADLDSIKSDILLFQYPFHGNLDDVPVELQLEHIDLQGNYLLK